jgi:predicted DNA-binding transcriptional regulator AlpA
MENPFEAIDRRLARLEKLLLAFGEHLRVSSVTTRTEVGGIELAQEITSLSKSRLYTLVAARQLPHAKRGNRLYFTRSELQGWITAGRRYSPGE